MITKAIIKKYGLDSKTLKQYFTAKVPDANVARLTQLIADRIKDGRERALSDYRIWAAVDMSYDEPFEQTVPTLLRGIMERGKSAQDILEALRGWGFDEEKMFTKEVLGDGKIKWHFNGDMFFNMFVPLVKSYVTIRLAKLFNDRNLTPLFEYPPRQFTAENRLLCRIITEVVETVSTNYGYSATLRSFIYNALMYSVSLKFPIEPWHKDREIGDDGEVTIKKEGIRYATPHITRTYSDLTYPLDTYNTGTGCEYGGYWTILKWGEVALDPNLWNRNSVPHGTNWLDPNAIWYNYFKEVYPCTLEFPRPDGRRRNDRENMAFRYTRTDYDCAFFLTYHFQKLIPAQWGLGDYPFPVWMRFTIGGDSTVMFAEVFPYDPIDYIGYDVDANRGRNMSMALEILPFQDVAGNVLNQLLQTIKRNLANIVFYDTDTVNKDDLESLKRTKNQQFGGLNFIGFSGTQMEREGTSIDKVVKAVTFPFGDTNQIIAGLNTVISMLERVLAISSQEIGAAASHQQSKKEVEITAGSSTNRLAYTGSYVDEGVDAWKRRLAEACIGFMDGKEVMASVPMDLPNLEENLKKIGFEVVEQPEPGRSEVIVRGKISQLHLVQIIARRSDSSRQNDTSVAQLMLQTIQSIANNPIFVNLIDPASLLELIEYAAKLGGADDDFKIRLNTNGVLADKLQQTQQNLVQTVMNAVESEVVKPIADQMAQLKQADAQNAQQVAAAVADLQQKMAQISQMMGAMPPAPSQMQPPPAQPQPVQSPPQPAPVQPTTLSPDNPEHLKIAQSYLQRANFNKARARHLAAQSGYKM